MVGVVIIGQKTTWLKPKLLHSPVLHCKPGLECSVGKMKILIMTLTDENGKVSDSWLFNTFGHYISKLPVLNIVI